MTAIDAYSSKSRSRNRGAARARLREAAGVPGRSGARAARRALHWLESDPREVVSLRSVQAPPRTSSGPALADPGQLAAGLRRFRGAIARRRAAVLVRRQLTAAVLLAIAIQAFVLAGLLGRWAPAAVLAALALALVVALRRPLPLDGVARLLDERLTLFDQLSTAFEIEQRGPSRGRPLEQRALLQGAAVLRSDSGRWRVSGSPAAGEWLRLGGALALLALLVALGASGAVGAGSRAGIAPGASGAALAHRGAGYRAGTGARAPGARPPRSSTISKSVAHRPPAGTRTAQSTRSAQGRLGHAGAPGSRSPRTDLRPTAGTPPPGSRSAAGSPPAGAHAITAVRRPGQAPPAGQRQPATGTRQPGTRNPATKGTSPAGGHAAAGSKAGGAHGGHTPGGNSAGNGLAGDRLRNGGPTRGRVSQKLSLTPGYAPARSRSAGPAGRAPENVPGGGGRGRSAGVGGGSAGAGGASAFSYVPPAGGATAEGRARLLERYFGPPGSIEEALASW